MRLEGVFAGKLYRSESVARTMSDLVNIKIAGKWMFIPLKMVLIGIDPYPFQKLTFWNPSIMCKIQKWPHQKAHKLA